MFSVVFCAKIIHSSYTDLYQFKHLPYTVSELQIFDIITSDSESRDLKMVVAKIRYEEGSYEGEVNEGKGKDDIPSHLF
jgi:hypothetical protein